MKTLIFGATGNCGKYIAKYLLRKGHYVVGVGRSQIPFKSSKFEYFRGDIIDKEFFNRLPSDFDQVINLAGVQPSILEFSEKTDLEATLGEYVNVNMVGIFNILEYVRKSKIQTYTYTTSHRDYELHWSNKLFLKNNLPPAINYSGDHTMYAISKTTGKMMGDYYSEAFGIRVFNLRLPMIFLVPDKPYYLANGQRTLMPFLKVIKQAMAGETLEIWGDPKMVRDYVHIDNLVFLINACFSSKLKRGTFNVGTGEAVTTEHFIKTIKKVFDIANKCELKYRPDKYTYKCAIYDITEQVSLLSYEPILLEQMLIKIRSELNKKDLKKYWI